MLFLTLWTSALIYLAYAEDDYDLIREAMENPDLFEGDMVVDMDADRNVIPNRNRRWSNAIVPYIIDSSLQDHEDVIKKAFKDYESKTCVRFEPRLSAPNFIRIFSGQGCYSKVGMVGGQQLVSLGRGCLYVGTAVHELGHALGFWHEHSRSDRDDYLEIYMENVKKGLESNFRKLSPRENLLLTPFDYNSIMIYPNTAFSKDGRSMTMKAKNNQKLINAAYKPGLTASDAKKINMMYC